MLDHVEPMYFVLDLSPLSHTTDLRAADSGRSAGIAAAKRCSVSFSAGLGQQNDVKRWETPDKKEETSIRMHQECPRGNTISK